MPAFHRPDVPESGVNEDLVRFMMMSGQSRLASQPRAIAPLAHETVRRGRKQMKFVDIESDGDRATKDL